jgi:hypothetical protein
MGNFEKVKDNDQNEAYAFELLNLSPISVNSIAELGNKPNYRNSKRYPSSCRLHKGQSFGDWILSLPNKWRG